MLSINYVSSSGVISCHLENQLLIYKLIIKPNIKCNPKREKLNKKGTAMPHPFLALYFCSSSVVTLNSLLIHGLSGKRKSWLVLTSMLFPLFLLFFIYFFLPCCHQHFIRTFPLWMFSRTWSAIMLYSNSVKIANINSWLHMVM